LARITPAHLWDCRLYPQVDTFGRATLRGAKLNEGTTEVQSSELHPLSSANGYISASLNSESTSCLYRIGLPALGLQKKERR
jgi:hypothetical protein